MKFEKTGNGEKLSTKDLIINVFTLNCWGLPIVSRHRKERIESIAIYLSEQNFDIVFLQELWLESDFERIRNATSNKYQFAHLFQTRSIVGTGIAILSKWHPSKIDFMPFMVNGSPFRPWHGDWFTGKGVAHIRIVLNDFRLHLFCTHMHAQYRIDEDISDQYCIHRICQSYQIGQYISKFKESATEKTTDLFILAGDLNTSPDDFPFQLIQSLTGMKDSCRKLETSADLITCGHMENTYTDGRVVKSMRNDLTEPGNSSSKRIDFILYKLVNRSGCNRTMKCYEMTGSEQKFKCMAERINCLTKDPMSGRSFSDHQPVAVELKIARSQKSIQSDLVRPLSTSSLGIENCDSGSLNSVDIGNSASIYSGDYLQSDVEEVEKLKDSSQNNLNCHSNCENLVKARHLIKAYLDANDSAKFKHSVIIFLSSILFIGFVITLNHFYDLFNLSGLILAAFGIIVVHLTIYILLLFFFFLEQNGIQSIYQEIGFILANK